MKNKGELFLAILVIVAVIITPISLVFEFGIPTEKNAGLFSKVVLFVVLLVLYFSYISFSKILSLKNRIKNNQIVIKDISESFINHKNTYTKDVLNLNEDSKSVSYLVFFNLLIELFGKKPIRFMADFNTKTKQNIFLDILKQKNKKINVVYGLYKEMKTIYGVIIENFYIKTEPTQMKTSKLVFLFSVALMILSLSTLYALCLTFGAPTTLNDLFIFIVVGAITVSMLLLSKTINTYEKQEEKIVAKKIAEMYLSNEKKAAFSSLVKKPDQTVYAFTETPLVNNAVYKVKNGDSSFSKLGWQLSNRIIEVNEKKYHVYAYGDQSSSIVPKETNKKFVFAGFLLPLLTIIEFYYLGSLSALWQKPIFIVIMLIMFSLMLYLCFLPFKSDYYAGKLYVDNIDPSTVINLVVENTFYSSRENEKYFKNKKIILFKDFAVALEKTFSQFENKVVLEEDSNFSKKSIKSLDISYRYKDGVKVGEFIIYNKSEMIDLSSYFGNDKIAWSALTLLYYSILVFGLNLFNMGFSKLFSIENFTLFTVGVTFVIFNSYSLKKAIKDRKALSIKALKNNNKI